jgi:4-hydroxy-3-polyprenylbenzoate decarboxylase
MPTVNRRDLVGAGLGASLAATLADTALAATRRPGGWPPPATAPGWGYGPFDSLRDYVAELDRRGLVLRIPRIDQDAYEATALMYRLIDRFGIHAAPAIVADQVRIEGRWVDGPLVINQYGPAASEAVALGIEPVPGDAPANYRAAMRRAEQFLVDGRFPTLPPRVVDRATAPCKEVVLTGDAIDVRRYAFIQSNPADAGRYVNTGSVFTWDPELGKNFGTYRCQIKGPTRLGVNPEPGQTSWRMLMKMQERGDKSTRISIALGQDPITWLMSTSKLGMGSADELELVGGIRGRPLDVVKSETNDILVPAHAEMIIEGILPLDQPMLPEGPFGEMRGYMGRPKAGNFWMDITCITHRKRPWVVNQFTGVNRGSPGATSHMYSLKSLQAAAPGVTMLHTPSELPGFAFVSVRKERKGQGLEVGRIAAERVGMAKIVVVVDDDIDAVDPLATLHAMGAQWQPDTAHAILGNLRGHLLDPSLANPPTTSKIVVDATRQWPDEGGPKVYQVRNRTLLEQQAPDAIARVDARWDDLVGGWRPPEPRGA